MLAGLAGGVGTPRAANALDSAIAGFGHAEADDDVGAEPLLKIGQEPGGESGGAVKEAHGVVGVIGRRVIFRQYGHHHTDKVDDGSVGVSYLLPKSGGAETVLDHQRGARCQSSHSAVILGVGVKVGQAGEKAVGGAGLRPQGKPLAGSDIHLMGNHDALGIAGSAGSVLQHCDVGGGNIGEGFQRRRGVQELAIRLPGIGRGGAANGQAMLNAGGEVGGGGCDIQQAVVGDQSGRGGVVQDKRHFVAPVCGVDGYGDAANQGEPKPGVEHFRDIGEKEAYAVAVSDTQLAEQGRRRPAAAHKIAVGNALAVDFYEYLAGVGVGSDLQEFA